MPKWFEDDDLWRDLYPILFSKEQWNAAELELDHLLELVGDQAILFDVLQLVGDALREDVEEQRLGLVLLLAQQVMLAVQLVQLRRQTVACRIEIGL